MVAESPETDRNPQIEKQSQSPEAKPKPVILFDEIAGGTSEVVIEHAGQRYILRATRNGRLLLNK